MFEHGSLQSVVDEEKEPCGCPLPAKAEPNEFPLAQSEGLTLTPKAAAVPATPGSGQPAEIAPLVYNGAERAPKAAPPQPPAAPSAATPVAAPANPPATKKKRGFFGKVGHFFGRVFGAE